MIAAGSLLVYNQNSSSGSSSVVERDLAKVDVAGSTPVSRSIKFLVLPLRWTFFTRNANVFRRGAVPKW
jgi:hypothetical protein